MRWPSYDGSSVALSYNLLCKRLTNRIASARLQIQFMTVLIRLSCTMLTSNREEAHRQLIKNIIKMLCRGKFNSTYINSVMGNLTRQVGTLAALCRTKERLIKTLTVT